MGLGLRTDRVYITLSQPCTADLFLIIIIIKGLGTSDALLCVSHTLQSALESGQEARIVQIDFSAVFNTVNHQGILYRLWSVGVGGSVLSMLTQFLSNRSQHVMVDGCFRSAAGKCFVPVIVPPAHFGVFFHSGK